MPIAVGLNVIAHRSDEAKERRNVKSWQSWEDKAGWKREDWHSWHSRQDWGHRGSERASWSRSCGSDAEWQGAGWRQNRSWNNEQGAEWRSPRQDAPQPESQTADAPQPQSQTAVAPQPQSQMAVAPQSQSNPWEPLSDTIWQPPQPSILPQTSRVMSLAAFVSSAHNEGYQEGYGEGWNAALEHKFGPRM